MPPPTDSLARQATLVRSLLAPSAWPHPTTGLALIETHISWIVLTGQYAYKLKKPLDLGFLDFSSLETRHECCEQEVRLNRRTAASIYLGVSAITGTFEHPRVDDPGALGAPLEYAVRMRQFDPALTLDGLLDAGLLRVDHIDVLAEAVARFHGSAARAEAHSPYGQPDLVLAHAMANLDALGTRLPPAHAPTLARLRAWTLATHERLRPTIAARHAIGCVRECHGDLHLANVALIDDVPVPFDCIEFAPELRWIDVASEIAFTVMDLHDRARPDLAWRFIDHYLEHSGDHGAIPLLAFHSVYRALVRAKVASIRASQSASDTPEARGALAGALRHVTLAERLAAPTQPRLILTCGLSGSGKSTIAALLLESIGAIRLRSDVERQRLFVRDPASPTMPSPVADGMYSAEATRRTYDRLADLAGPLLEAGLPVIVDATFLRRAERNRFAALARGLGVPFHIVRCDAPAAILRARIEDRLAHGRDPSEADERVLEHQLANHEAFSDSEKARAFLIDTDCPRPVLAERAARIGMAWRAPD